MRRINRDLTKSFGPVEQTTLKLCVISVSVHAFKQTARRYPRCFDKQALRALEVLHPISKLQAAVCISCETVKCAEVGIEHSVDNITRL